MSNYLRSGIRSSIHTIRVYFNKSEQYILQHYEDQTSYESRFARHLYYLAIITFFFALINRLIHNFNTPREIDLISEFTLLFFLLFSVYMIYRRRIDIALYCHFLNLTIVILIHFVLKDYYANDLTFVHPFHIFQVSISIIILLAIISSKLIYKQWLIFSILYAIGMHLAHGYALQRHFEFELVGFLTAVAIFDCLLIIISLWYSARFQFRQQQTIYQQREALELTVSDLNTFSYVASHDLIGPVKTIMSFQNLIAGRIEAVADPKTMSILSFAQQSAKNLNNVLEDLLKYTRITQGKEDLKLEKVCLKKVIDQLIIELKQSEEKNHQIITEGELPEIYGVESYFKILLQNLFSNGIKFNDAPMAFISIRVIESNHKVFILVKDNGIGISKEHQDQIFEPFQRLHHQNTYKGTGFGLAICKRIVEQMNGQITVESTLGAGSTFLIKFPKE